MNSKRSVAPFTSIRYPHRERKECPDCCWLTFNIHHGLRNILMTPHSLSTIAKFYLFFNINHRGFGPLFLVVSILIWNFFLSIVSPIFSLYYEWFRLWFGWLLRTKPHTATQGPPTVRSKFLQNDGARWEAAGTDNGWPVPSRVLRQNLIGQGRNDRLPQRSKGRSRTLWQ